MTMKNSLLLIGIAAAAFCYQACYEDKGHYDYLPVNKVTITTPLAALSANMGDTLYFTPTITFANPADTTGFEYWWEYMGSGMQLDHYEMICEGRELRFVPQMVGSQSVQFCVKELRSGMITTAAMIVNGGSIYTKGWLILREENGESKLTFIRPDRLVPGDATSGREYVPYIDLYGQLFPDESLGSGPIALRQAFSVRSLPTVFYVIQENNPICLNGVSYAREIRLAQEFIGSAPAGFAPLDYYQADYSSVTLSGDGTLYYRCPYYGNGTDFFTYSFANFPMEYRGQVLKIERIIPNIANKAFFFAVYDKENKRFLWIYAGAATAGGSILPADITANGLYLDYNNVDDAEILYSAFYNEAQVGMLGVAYNITLYVKGGNVYVQRCRGTGESGFSVVTSYPIDEVQHTLFSGQAYLSSDTKFYQLKTRTYLFFATGNQLYWYDLLAETTRLFYTFPAGDEVVDMDSNPQESELGVVLTSGKFITLNIEDDRLMSTDNKIYEIELPGKIVDLEYKLPNFSTYSARTYIGNWD
jgi:hypothetical protein